MYCVKCGVELMKGVRTCPLCGTAVYHPDIDETPEAPLYPRSDGREETVSPSGVLFVLTFLFLIPVIVCLLVDLRMNGRVDWSGFVSCGLGVLYVCLCLPFWFRRRDPVIFVPICFAAFLLGALYICLKTGGSWFLSFALPVGGTLMVIVETAVTLCRHTVGRYPHRYFYIFSGVSFALGALCVLIEFLLCKTFGLALRWWSLIPLAALVLLGVLLLVIAISRPLRQSLYKRLFI